MWPIVHLKSLTLKGFKSFASPTTLRFEPGITVVERAIDQVCTVGRTLKSGTKVTFEVSDAGVS